MSDFAGILSYNNRINSNTLSLINNNFSNPTHGYGATYSIYKKLYTCKSSDKVIFPAVEYFISSLSKTNVDTILVCADNMSTFDFNPNALYKDLQPYASTEHKISFCCTGTVTNLKELCKQANIPYANTSAVVFKVLINFGISDIYEFAECIKRNFEGSFAIALFYGTDLLLINTYKQFYYSENKEGFYFATDNIFNNLPGYGLIQKTKPYSYMIISKNNERYKSIGYLRKKRNRSLIIASGGLDSTVVISQAIYDTLKLSNEKLGLLYFKYGCKAGQLELKAVTALSNYFNIPLFIITLQEFEKMIVNSTCLSKETTLLPDLDNAHIQEWVPARNTIMASYAIAFAEINGYDNIYIGTNAEEAGAAFPDSDPGFVKGFNDMMHFITTKNITIKNPIGHMMKHEIVKLGHGLNSPMHLSWSCYEGGELHCGKCAPCVMRKKAFIINKLPDTITYKE